MSERFTPEELKGMLPGAAAHERHHRAITNGDACEDTQKEGEDIVAEADSNEPAQYEIDEKKESERQRKIAREAIAKMRAFIQEREPKRPDYDIPPKSPKD